MMTEVLKNESDINIISTFALGVLTLDHDSNPNIVNTNINTTNINTNVSAMHNLLHNFLANARNFNVNHGSRHDGGFQRGRGTFMCCICVVYVLFYCFSLLCLFCCLLVLFLNCL